MSFEYLGLSEPLLKAVKDAGYDTPTPIQRQAIPSILMGRDVIGIAQTGTGKTAGFTLPMIDILAEGRTKARMPRSLILEPTRELAAQVAESFEKYGKYHKLSMALLIGGVSFADQETKLDRGVDVLIATPGRLLDHFERGKLMLTGVQILVVDECDRMLDMGFIPDVERICKLMPQRHQTLFFSATLSKEIKRLTDQFLSDPKLIEVAPPASPAETVEQRLVVVGPREKSKALRTLIADEEVTNAIVFCNRKVEVKSVYLSLKRAGISVGQLHGDMAQPDRMDMLARFKGGEVKILVASDVAARGLDIPRVSHVFNFDVPHNAEDYVHRIGRTGRAGRKGIAVMIAVPEDAEAVAEIEKLIGREIPRIALDGVRHREITPPAGPAAEDASRGRRRGRGGRGRRTEASEKKDTPEPSAKAAAVPTAAPVAQDAPERAEPERAEPTRAEPARAEPARKGERAKERERSKPRRRRPERAASETKPASRKTPGRPVVGLGDHVPAFLRRPARPRD